MNPLILKAYECVACGSTAIPPIMQCPNGHIYCLKCHHSMQNRCVECSSVLGDIRNWASEEILPYIQLSCKNENEKRYRKILEMFKCGICYFIAMSPIMQCLCSFLYCAKCHPKMQNKCGACRRVLGDIHNRVLDTVGMHMLFPCEYEKTGCTKYTPLNKMALHQKYCKYRFVCLYFGKCYWTGQFNEILPHITEKHKIEIKRLRTLKLQVKLSSLRSSKHLYFSQIQECFGKKFLVCVDGTSDDRQTCILGITVKLLSSYKDARKYMCRIEMADDQEFVPWEEMPQRLDENIFSTIENSQCFVLTTSNVEETTIFVTISKLTDKEMWANQDVAPWEEILDT